MTNNETAEISSPRHPERGAKDRQYRNPSHELSHTAEDKPLSIFPTGSPSAVPANEPFSVFDSSLVHWLDHPEKVEFGAVLLCISGEALLTVGDRQCLLKVRTEVTLLPNAVCMLLRSSSDFCVKYFSFSPAMFQESSFRLSSSYVGFIKDRIYIQLPDEHFRYSVTFFELLESLYLDISNQYRDRIATNLLQNYLLNACDKITRYNTCVDIRDTDRPTNLFKRFVSLLHTHIVSVRDISFYASSLSISPRYLSAITRRNSSMSAKSFIDDCLLQEIKLLLLSTDLSIQELSDRLHFSDQSHLGRFFKRHTGLSPSVYRKSGNTPPFRE